MRTNVKKNKKTLKGQITNIQCFTKIIARLNFEYILSVIRNI